MRGVFSGKSAREILAKAQASSGLSQAEADALALEETASHRMGR